jgi:hypothetical protein
MAHYAFIDENNNVVEVIVGRDEGELGIDWEQHYGEFRGMRCLRTSYNTHNGEHLKGGTPFRGNYASIGMRYDEELDQFVGLPVQLIQETSSN